MAVLLLTAPAEAQRSPRKAEKSDTPRVANAERSTKPAAKDPQKASSPLMAVISIAEQRISIYDKTGKIMQAPVSTGQAGHRTPTGIFSVIQKNRYHESNIYSGAPMPYMQRITWSGIALHEGRLPGYPASHGCIRLPGSFAAQLFALSRMGMRVVVAPSDVAFREFSHPALPSPLMTPAPTAELPGQATLKLAAAGPADDAGASPVVERFVNPLQRAQAQRLQARAELSARVKNAKEALEHAQTMSSEANAAAARLRAAEDRHARAESRVQAVATAEVAAQAAAQREALAADMRGAIGDLADAIQELSEARAIEAVRTPASYAAAVASRESDEALVAAQDALRAAERAVEPVSVFVSRREGKLFVRQGFVPVLDAPVTFKDSGPLGTHLFVAVEADDRTGALAWKSLSVPESSGAALPADRPPVRRGGPPTEPTGARASAAEVLDRVEIPAEIMQKVQERLWLGASLIVSDHGLGTETGKGTDFVVLTR